MTTEQQRAVGKVSMQAEFALAAIARGDSDGAAYFAANAARLAAVAGLVTAEGGAL